MPYLSQGELEAMNFASLGRNVLISTKASIYDPQQIEIGDSSRIDDFCVLSGKLVIGRNVYVAPFCLVAGGLRGVTLKDFSTLAYRVSVFSQTDDYSGNTLTNSTVPRKYKKEKFEEVIIGKHAIVGTSAVVFPGVEIAEGCSVGALSLVTESTEPWGIYCGTPARKLKNRSKNLLIFEEQFLKIDTLK